MNIEEVMSRIDEGFDIPDIQKREAQRAKQIAPPVPPQPVPPIDIYQRNRDRIRGVSQKRYPRGSSAIVRIAVQSVIDGAGGEGLAQTYRRARNDSESLRERGERGRAELLERQYMMESFLPAVEIVVASASPDEVLNSKDALRELDKYVISAGSGDGYTASYIRQTYGNELGHTVGRSDHATRDAVRRVNELLDGGEVRMARDLAGKAKRNIDEGKSMADEIDYEFLGRIVSFYD